MSGGQACHCPESKKPVAQRDWIVWKRNHHNSHFSGRRYTTSDYSALQCFQCSAIWRTKAAYVSQLKDGNLTT